MIELLPVEVVWILGVFLHMVIGDGDKCEYHFSYKKQMSGNFKSPKFPKFYPELITCHYYFDAATDGRIQIDFDVFELEPMAKDDTACRFDYVDIFSVDRMGYKTLLSRFCGSEKPEAITSIQSRLEIIFVSDYTKTANGFLGQYTFLDDTWQPFGPPTQGCGSETLTGAGGVISSPNFPSPFPGNTKCTWLIKVKEGYQIFIHHLALDIGESAQCDEKHLLIYNGFATPDMVPEERLCGQLHSYHPSMKEFLSSSSRVVIRFISTSANTERSKGFQLVWSAVRLPEDGTCAQFTCAGGQHCYEPAICMPLERYCIDESLHCDGVPNCGPFDDSDERKCLREILIVAACIGFPSFAIIGLIVTVVYCYRTKRVKKSMSQEQPLANKKLSSRDSMTPTRSQCMMHTSFIDGKPIEERNFDRADNGTLPVHIEPLKTHQKRASYHMMKQNDLEDGGGLQVIRENTL
ncbi:membrane frizzled-related protein-like [Gigantopelta aegis]|uniref:membrane frizzled-related protein-like n=1 Tax=Gigantopelta aegis TaxID=1735272 RepID=UPI001B88D5BC|nr:membrane frizzled-related protein-like [Gigantopelta aegis]XP_041354161.1 membrane frizzled-related protein-like [Gigantopelta aegis]XP_041354162.1 membrane frizzled-related protein-like [Gigantopelta aegis]XP_041354164.1 membrane frizzled-related protein-like [Gigantopelta aegis]